MAVSDEQECTRVCNELLLKVRQYRECDKEDERQTFKELNEKCKNVRKFVDSVLAKKRKAEEEAMREKERTAVLQNRLDRAVHVLTDFVLCGVSWKQQRSPTILRVSKPKT